MRLNGKKIRIMTTLVFLFTSMLVLYIIVICQSGKHVGEYLLSSHAVNNTERETDQLLGQHFITKEGLLTQGVGSEGSKSVLLESQGQLMEYALLAKDRNLFDAVFNNVQIHFLALKGYYYWRLSLPDLKPDNATALLDQLRLIRSLDNASTVFGGPFYRLETTWVAFTLYRFNRVGNLFCDSYDGRTGKGEQRISLFYIDTVGLNIVSAVLPQAKPAVQNTISILKNSPINELGFFPSWYDLSSGSYIWPKKFMTIEQLFTIDFAQNAGMNVNTSLEFLRNSIRSNKKIFNAYLKDGSPDGLDDSVAVYALAARVFRQAGDVGEAQWCYERMLAYRIKEQNSLHGAFAYETSQSAFAFDQMEALLTLYQEGKIAVDK